MYASPLGLLIGLSLGALGGGGSILAVPVLVYAAGQSPQEATATSLVVVGLAAVIGLVDHHRAGRVQWPIGLVFIATGIAGALAGTKLNAGIDGDVLLVLFALLMLVIAVRMVRGRRRSAATGDDAGAPTTAGDACDPATGDVPVGASCATVLREGLSRPGSRPGDGAPRQVLVLDRVVGTELHDGSTGTGLRDHPLWRSRRCLVRLVLAGSLVGFLTGLFGVGGGFIIVPAFTLGLGLAMPEAVGTSLLIIVGNAVVSLAGRGLGAVDWSVAAPFAVAAGIGVVVGSRLSGRIPAERSTRAFGVLTIAVALYTGGQALTALLSS